MVKIKLTFPKHWREKMQQIKRPLQHKPSLGDNQCRERGSVVVIVALSLTVLLGLCAVVADMAILYAQKAQLQNSVDSAALAGAQELLKSPSDATSMAIDYATRNGATDVNVSVEANNAIIVVQAKQQVPTYFARIWGITEEQISVSARAMLVPPTGLYGAVPLSIQEQDLVFGQKYILKSGGGSGTSEWYLDDDKNNSVRKYGEEYGTSGWYGALELSGTGANTYESDLANGYQDDLFVGQILNVKHGNMSGPTADGINTRINRDARVPRNTIDSHDRNAPQIVYIPIVRIISESGNSIHEVQIVGFTAFFLEGVAGNGNESIVTGWFIRTLASNAHSKDHLSDLLKTEQDIANGEASNDYGLYMSKLIAN